MRDGIARPDDVKWPKNALAYLSTIQRSQEQLTHRTQLAEKILLALISNYNDPLRDCTREDRAEYAVREADALIAALERK